ncbi:endonuclease/exonuclease/phosphatase family protein [Streptomyces sp. NBC_01506]|uniref:endonuclease/exonuclease/phosphatase family protein n=1 Tax=Streptomyces sp. NBC_01506 TaxID=2903887 RepID=UPI00386D937B
MTSQTTLDLLTFNLNNPSRQRAERQLAYLMGRSEEVLVLTETANSAGCDLLESRFHAEGYHVTFPRPGRGERGVMIVSRLATMPGRVVAEYLPHRAVSVTVDTQEGPLDVVGLYVPSRDGTAPKRARKEKFLEDCRLGLPGGKAGQQVVIGDFNILEPDHSPRYGFFKGFEYGFYNWLGEVGYADAYRELHPDSLEYSWVGRTGDGYRYDHAHVSADLRTGLRSCSYVHGPRTCENRLTDHSALTLSLALHPNGVLREPGPPAPHEGTDALFPVPARSEEAPMEDTTWTRIEMLRTWLDENAAPVGDERLWRILKISEEVGEVAEAMHGAAGTNPRKGRSHTWDDVNKELCDVIVTSMVALATCTPDAAKLLDDRLQHLVERVTPS